MARHSICSSYPINDTLYIISPLLNKVDFGRLFVTSCSRLIKCSISNVRVIIRAKMCAVETYEEKAKIDLF